MREVLELVRGPEMDMADQPSTLWSSGDAYERYMGRWSRRIAPHFVSWLPVEANADWLDLGCGTGGLTDAVLRGAEPSRIVGVDSADAFVAVAREHVSDPRAKFMVGDATSVPEPSGSFDAVVCGLVLNFLPDKEAALREMIRLVRPGGIVALYVWDYAGHMQIMRHIFDAAAAFDTRAAEFDDGRKAPICRPGPLRDLLTRTGLSEVEVRPIDIAAAFESFDDYWTPFLGGTGSAPKYVASLDEGSRERLRQAVRSRLPTGPDGEILLAVRAWAAKGRRQDPRAA